MPSKKSAGLVVISGLLPTIGHKYLIDFASKFVDRVHVVVSIRSFEPSLTLDRAEVLAKHYAGTNVTIHEHYDDNAPQNDDGTPEFWQYWKDMIGRAISGRVKLDYLFASEKYGHKFAEVLGLTFIPVDIAREILSVKGTDVRQNLAATFKYILPEYQHILSKNIVITGPESCGKTTMTKWLANKLQGRYVHEWARPYLEEVGAELNDAKMLNIVMGQNAAMAAAPRALFNVYDTDLTATEMYYDIGSFKKPKILLDKITETCSNSFYIIMNDQIPFEADPLRYGGDVRESATGDWIAYYEKRGLNYYVIQETKPIKQQREIIKAVYENFKDLREIEEFERD